MSIQDDWDGRDICEALTDDHETARLRRQHKAAGDLAIESLPTVYRGTTFRSALEASWAATLDSLSITWEYEPEMVTLPSGARYLPDFHLTEIGVWLEVKGDGVPRVEKAIELGQSLACDCPRFSCTCRWPGGELVIIGNPPKPFDPWANEDYDHWPSHSRRRLSWRHGGFLRWSSTRPGSAWLTRCSDCRRITWFDIGRCRACRGPLAGCEGFQSGSDAFTFIRISGPAVTDDTTDDTQEDTK